MRDFRSPLIFSVSGRTGCRRCGNLMSKNSRHLAQTLEDITLDDDEILNSHDVVSLFTNTPINKSLEVIKERLTTDNSGGKKLKIGQYLAKIWTKLFGVLFWATLYTVQCESKNPPMRLSEFFSFFQKRLRIFNRFLHTYYTFLCTLDYKFLFNYL